MADAFRSSAKSIVSKTIPPWRHMTYKPVVCRLIVCLAVNHIACHGRRERLAADQPENRSVAGMMQAEAFCIYEVAHHLVVCDMFSGCVELDDQASFDRVCDRAANIVKNPSVQGVISRRLRSK